jgi:hypothetical protein
MHVASSHNYFQGGVSTGIIKTPLLSRYGQFSIGVAEVLFPYSSSFLKGIFFFFFFFLILYGNLDWIVEFRFCMSLVVC